MMIRDTFFNMSRFVTLCRKEMVESWKANILRMSLMYGVMAILFVWNGYLCYSSYPGMTTDLTCKFGLRAFPLFFCLFGCISASLIMERMKTKTSRLSVLMTPTTMFEKFFSRWLIFTFGFIIVYLIAFKLADWTRVLVFMISYPELKDVITSVSCTDLVGDGTGWGVFNNCRYLIFGMSFYLFAQSVFVLGSAIWPRNSFMKTFTAIILIIIVYSLVGTTLIKIVFANRSFNGISQAMSEEAMIFWGITINILLSLFHWVLAYFRFKESEIINRW